MHASEVHLCEVASHQCGVFARRQAFELGLTDDVIRRRIRSAAWSRVGPGVYSLPGFRETWARRLWIAYLAIGPDAAVSHEAAAEIHRLEGVLRGQLTFTVGHSHHHRISGAFVHQLTDVRPEWVTTVEGLPVTTPGRTIVDLAAVMNFNRLSHVVEHARIARIVSLDEVATCLGQLARKGKPGVRKLGAVLDRLGPGDEIPASVLEAAFFPMLKRGGLPDPIRQFAHPGRQIINGCVDCAYLDAKLILEVDGRRWHTRIRDLKRDRERDNEAARVGWLTLRFLYEHVKSDPEGVCATIRDTRAVRVALLGPAA